jgi:hypothetical protein
MKAIESEELGKIILLIFLRLVSLQQTVGHLLGPRSMELQDLFRLDETIAEFLNYLDKTVGKDNYLLF